MQRTHIKPGIKFFFFISFQMVFVLVLCIGLIYYGPFTNIRDMIVTSAMSTLNHKYIATLFLSKDQIDQILRENAASISNGSEDLNEIKINSLSGHNDIQYEEIDTLHFIGHLLIVQNPKDIGIGTASSLGKVGDTLTQIVSRYKAVGGINAGGFSDANRTGSGGSPTGLIIENGTCIYKEEGAEKFDIIGFNDKNVLVIGSGWSLEKIMANKIRDGISFGPPLVINGKPMINKGNGGWGINPRTAIGQRKDGSVLLLTIDGRQIGSIGATLKEMQDVLIKYDAYNAANLDGGSSATMVYNGNVINKPCDLMGERAIPSAFIIK